LEEAERLAFVVNTRESSDSWITTRKYDAKKGREREFYECPIDQAQLIQI